MSKRRYPLGQHEIYDYEFNKLSLRSPVLNPLKSTEQTAWISTAMQSRQGLETILQIFAGDASFKWTDKGEKRSSYLYAAEQSLAEIHSRFESVQNTRAMEGLPPLTDWPADLMEKRLRCEAAVDVCRREIAALNALLARFCEADEQKQDAGVLVDGPRGIGKMRNGKLSVIDGQTVEQDANGLLRIHDPRSPFDGLPAAIYHERIVLPWCREFAKARRAFEKLKEFGDAATMKRRPGRPPLPEWPENVPRYDWATDSEIVQDAASGQSA